MSNENNTFGAKFAKMKEQNEALENAMDSPLGKILGKLLDALAGAIENEGPESPSFRAMLRALQSAPINPEEAPEEAHLQSQLAKLSQHFEGAAPDLDRYLEALHEEGAQIYVGSDVFGNVPMLTEQFLGLHAKDGVSEAQMQVARDAVSTLLDRGILPWAQVFRESFISASKIFPYTHNTKLRLRLSSQNEPIMHAHADEDSMREQALSPVSAREALAAYENSFEGGMPGSSNVRFAGLRIGGGPEHDGERSPLFVPGFSGVAHVGIGHAAAPPDVASLQSGSLLYPVMDSDTQRKVLQRVASRLDWELPRYLSTQGVLSALTVLGLFEMRFRATQLNMHYRISCSHRLTSLACEEAFHELPEVSCPWGYLSNDRDSLDLLMAVNALPIVMPAPSIGEHAKYMKLDKSLVGRAWHNPDTNDWVVFWGPLTMMPEDILEHSFHNDCDPHVTQMPHSAFMDKINSGKWLLF